MFGPPTVVKNNLLGVGPHKNCCPLKITYPRYKRNFWGVEPPEIVERRIPLLGDLGKFKSSPKKDLI